MANTIRDYSATAASNTVVDGADISEGCSPAGINDAIRGVMADLKDVSTGAVALESPAMDSLTVDTTTLVVDAVNNRVGVGTASPATALDVTGTVTADGLTVNSSTTDPVGTFISTNAIAALDIVDSYGTCRISNSYGSLLFESDKGSAATSSNIKFLVDDSEAMRIDSGNLLVGTTTGGGTIGTYNGFGALAGGTIFSSATSNRSIFARRSTDGSIIDFRKDGTTVGSIGTDIYSQLFIGEGSTTGFRFDSSANRIMPGATNPSDNLTDLGASTSRFKDLYLSGGVYLGGTGSANYLDDYEEGTFTPTFTAGISNPTVSYDQQVGHYQKIGNTVYFSVQLGTGSVSGGSGDLYISGFPFTSSSSKGSRSGAWGLNYTWNGNVNPASWWMNQGANFLYLYFNNNNASSITTSHMWTGSGANRIWIQGFYTTDA